jgi:hypothetical protein
MMLKKIMSGGQIGADQAALDIAIKMGIPHGGWIQKGRKIQGGILPEKYQLQEMSTSSFKDRIEKNVKASDGTLIIAHGDLAGGADYSRKMARKHGRPCLFINLNETSSFSAATGISRWIKENRIEILNVTGSRASEDSKIYKDTMDIVERAILLGQITPEAREPAKDLKRENRFKKRVSAPKSVGEAVTKIITDMPLLDRVKIANIKKEDLISLELTLGVFIRNQFLKKDFNGELLASCHWVSGSDTLTENEAAAVIIERLWENLRETHRLRVVK